MVRQVTIKQVGSFKALLAISVATGGLIWHLMACIESPMAFSPDGKNLAFVTMEPHFSSDSKDGLQACRLMILSDDKRLRVIEETGDLLSSPGYSPDGTRLCYVRIPRLTEERGKLLEEHIKRQIDAFDLSSGFSWSAQPERSKNTPAAAVQAEPSSPRGHEVMMPWFGASVELARRLAIKCSVPAALIVRNTETGDVISTTSVEWPMGDEPGISLLTSYLTTRPQYDSDGKWVYLCVGDIVMGVNPSTGDKRIYALAAGGLLSPDGATIAVLVESAVGFIRTDGRTVAFAELKGKLSRSGMAWVAKDKLAALVRVEDAAGKRDVLHSLRTDGTIIASRTLPLPEYEYGDGNTGEMAISPNGAHMVLAYGKDVFFMDRDGSVRRHWRGDKEQLMAQPTFAPNSKRIAMKLLDEEEDSYGRVTAIVFFTPTGEEISRAAVPKINPALTRPASPSAQPDE